MPRIAKPLRAKVEWWNHQRIYIRCPLCQDIHHHSWNGNYLAKQHRSSDCRHSAGRYWYYEICFPQDNTPEDMAYDIDKQKALFVAAGADPTPYFSRFEDDFPAIDFSGRRKWAEAREMTFGPCGDRIERIRMAVASLVSGRVKEVREYLDNSKEAGLFIHGVDIKVTQFDPHSDSDDDGAPDAENRVELRVSTSFYVIGPTRTWNVLGTAASAADRLCKAAACEPERAIRPLRWSS